MRTNSRIDATNFRIDNETARANSVDFTLMQSVNSLLMLLLNETARANAAEAAILEKVNILAGELIQTKSELLLAKATISSFAQAQNATFASAATSCTGNSSSLSTISAPSCALGFAPSTSSTPFCSGSNLNFPTTFGCKGTSPNIELIHQ